MKYKIILSKFEILVDEEDKDKIVKNIDKNFIILKSGEIINPSFVQGVIIDREATAQERKELKMIQNRKEVEEYKQTADPAHIKDLFEKYKPDFGALNTKK